MTFLPIAPNWKSAISETISFNTEVIESDNGREQRISHRRNPRVELQFSAILPPGRLKSIYHTLGSAFGEKIELVDPTSPVAETTAAREAGLANLPLNQQIAYGSYATMNDFHATLVEVGTMTTLTAPLRVALSDAVPAYSPVYKVKSGYIGAVQKVNQITDGASTYAIKFLVDPQTTYDATYTGVKYEGYPLLTMKPNWSAGIDLTYDTPFDSVDYENGVIHNFKKVLSGSFTQGMSYSFDIASDLAVIRDLFISMKGRQGQFLCPTFTNDMTLQTDLLAGSTSLTVKFEREQHFDDLFWITFFTSSGTSFCRRVTNITSTTGGNHILTLNAAPPSTIARSNVVLASQTRMARFASDSLKINYLTTNVSNVLQNVKTTMTFDIRVWNDLLTWEDTKIWED